MSVWLLMRRCGIVSPQANVINGETFGDILLFREELASEIPDGRG